MDFQLKSARLQLNPFTKGDLDLLHGLFIHPSIREFLWDDRVLSLSETKDILRQNDGYFKNRKWGLWKVQAINAEQVMGFTGLWPFFGQNQPQVLYALL
ncbi:MAG: GNAT family N-acetyltransferase, partial [Saprospiraceae bacterium]|nr:GNAT family N-acetyltransferase [Saprospiraceae bacterium]